MQIKVTPNKEFRKALVLASQWPARAAAVRRFVIRQVVGEATAELKKRLPTSSEYGDLTKTVRLSAISGMDSSYLISMRAVRGLSRDYDARKTVLFISPRKGRLVTNNPIVSVLERYSPWTPDTLPVAPKRREATVYYRKVSKSEAAAARRARKRDKKKWKLELEQLGVRVRGSGGIDLARAKVLPDIASISMNLEFGLRGQSRPHWRPAMMVLRKGDAAKRAMKTAKRALTDLEFMGWKAWPEFVGDLVGSAEVEKYKHFQDKIGVL